MSQSVDIVVPIYNAFKELCLCLDSLALALPKDGRVLLIDDKSTDPRIQPLLERFAVADERFKVIQQAENKGFVKSANLGMRYDSTRDVLLLNSDTIVTPGFLEQLQDCAYASPTTGVVCPLSNNATICSVPSILENNPIPHHISLSEINELLQLTESEYPVLPTAHGFCMFIKRAVIEKIGVFDEVFGKGFGEENDFSERALAEGFEIRLCDATYVAHLGKASFGEDGHLLEAKHLPVLLQRHPDYLDTITKFIEENPLASVQQRFRYLTSSRVSGTVLFVLHADPFSPHAGGVELYVRDLVQSLRLPRLTLLFREKQDIVIQEVYDGDYNARVQFRYPSKTDTDGFLLNDAACEQLFKEILTEFDIRLVHFHQLQGLPLSLASLCTESQVPYVLSIHDYSLLSSDVFLIDENSPFDRVEATKNLFENAAQILTPSEDCRRKVSSALPTLLHLTTLPNGYPFEFAPSSTEYRGRGPLRISILGSVYAEAKGRENYLELIGRLRGAAIEWHIFSSVNSENFLSDLRSSDPDAQFTIHDRYEREELPELLLSIKPHLVASLPNCEETFSFTLSEALLAKIPVIGLARGAIAERLQAAGLSSFVVESVADAAEKIKSFINQPSQLNAAHSLLTTFSHTSLESHAARLISIYEDSAPRGVAARSASKPSASLLAYLDVIRPEPVLPLLSSADTEESKFLTRISSMFSFLPAKLRLKILARLYSSRFALLSLLRADKSIELSKDIAKVNGQKHVVQGPDPYMIFSTIPIPSKMVDILFLRFRCRAKRASRTQLFWATDKHPTFEETRSVSLPVEANNRWQNLVIEVETLRNQQLWDDTETLTHLRIDPMESTGEFELDQFCFLSRKVSQ